MHHEPTEPVQPGQPNAAAHAAAMSGLPPEEREAYWHANIYRGDVKQLTVRAVIMGMMLGAVLSVSNLYVGLKIGWGFGVTITAGILAFAIFKALERVLPGGHFTDLENNAMQSVASAAGAMSSSGLTSAIPALLPLNGQRLDTFSLAAWLGAISLLGVVIAIPLKRQMINVDQLPFPSGIAAAETIRSLHGHGAEAIEKARMLGIAAFLSASGEYFRSFHALAMEKLGLKALAFTLPDSFAVFPAWRGIDPSKLTLQLDSSVMLLAAGAIVGLRTGISIMIGAVLNWFFVAPWLIEHAIQANGKVITGGYRGVVSWSTWPGAGTLVVATLVAMAFQWRSIARGFSGISDLWKKKDEGAPKDATNDIEVPGSWFGGGMAVASIATICVQYWLFSINPLLGVLSVIFAVVLSMVATRVAGETDIAPLGAMGKVTQFAYAAITPHQPVINLMSANVTAGAAAHTSDLLTDLKSGYILGARPRQQFLAQLFGVLVGTLACVPAFNLLVPDAKVLGEKFPAPAAQVWKATAEVLAKGIDAIPQTALTFAAVMIFVTIIVTVIEVKVPASKKYLPSPTGIGLAFIIPFAQSLSIFLGAILAWAFFKLAPAKAEKYTITGSSGLIAGESIMAVIIIACKKWMGEV
ncbi:MAG: Oligopeptide transporter, family [Cyanobacteria bacterium RYN_339]|nr:Oligopeptide transporter, family [Cyanobacteria bacterium RYN_339]